MHKQIREKREQRAKIYEQAKALLGKAEIEKRSLMADEQKSYDKMIADMGTLKTDIENLERAEQIESELRSSAGPAAGRPDPDGAGSRAGAPTDPKSEIRAAGFREFLAGGMATLTSEQRALQVSDQSAAGYLVAPEQFQTELIKFLNNAVFVRGMGTVIPVTSAQSLGVASLDADPADPDWTSELGTGGEDSAMKVGKRKFVPHPLAKRIKVSRTLLQLTAGGAETLVRDRLGYKMATTEENAFLNGDGVNKPLGIFVASSDGVPASRDTVNATSSTAPEADALIAAKYALKGGYRGNAIWVLHRDAIGKVAQLKGSDGQYLWRMGMALNEPDRLLNLPIMESEYAPNAFTAGTYYAALYGPKFYWIADAFGMSVQRLDELYAEANQVGFISRSQVDGQPVLAEAFVRVKTKP